MKTKGNRHLKMSLEEHLNNADDLAMAFHHLGNILNRCKKYLKTTSKTMKILTRFCHDDFIKLCSDMRNEFETLYHDNLDDTCYKNIYFDNEDRYNNLIKKIILSKNE